MSFDITNIVVDTERLRLREWKESDLSDLNECACSEEVCASAGLKPHASIEESIKALNAFIAEKNVFAVEYKADKKVVGWLALHGSWAHKRPEYKHLKIIEFGALLSKAFWGRGLMPEALNALIERCFGEWGFDALTVCHFLDNQKSERVIQKCGFRFAQTDEFYSKSTGITYLEKQYILFKNQGLSTVRIREPIT